MKRAERLSGQPTTWLRSKLIANRREAVKDLYLRAEGMTIRQSSPAVVERSLFRDNLAFAEGDRWEDLDELKD